MYIVRHKYVPNETIEIDYPSQLFEMQLYSYLPEKMNTSNPYIVPTQTLQELERLKFAQNLRKNPSDYASYVNQRVDEMSKEVFHQKRAAFQKAQIDLGRYMDMDHNANFYKSRSADVHRLTKNIEENNNRLSQTVAFDKDITKRQFQINEWSNYNKLETLFFLQLFFIASLTGAIVVFLEKNGIITNGLASILYMVLAVIAAGTGLYRYFYTTRTRDTQLWHRRYFGSAEKPKPAVQCDKKGNIVFDVSNVIPRSVTQCADEASSRFSEWQTNIQNEMMNYQSTGGAGLGGKGGICSPKS
jgi:hypothetical protein